MPLAATQPASEADRDSADRTRRREYTAAYREFASNLNPSERRRINGTASPDWESGRSFALSVDEESPAFRSDEPDPVTETLEELAGLAGALPKMALWISDRTQSSAVNALLAMEQFRMAVARVCEAKNPRLEAHLVSLAIGMNLHGNANGYAIAAHFSLKPQTIHEMLGDTCSALGLPKPLAKANKARYSKTQYSHNIRRHG